MYTIDVRFKNQGLESIEVQDNGDGISPQNYETVALKHYTSKLSAYSDLATLQTFGFRGEALSSLCALSHFSIITCMASDAPKGTKLDFEISGKLGGTSTVAAQKGTTVIVENLFNNLPVRRRELERNIKREWARVTGVLGQYACIQTGIKFSVSQQAAKGKKATLFSTKGNQTTRENIANVFGAKTLAALAPLDLTLELEPSSGPNPKWSTPEDGGKKDIRIVGHISRPVSGEGRQTPDRQMFFVNARPCGLPQVARAFNDVYKSYNASQSPFIFANIELDTHLYDVNVSPDKRTILLHDQTRMLENLKTALTELFESQDYTVPISQLSGTKQQSYKQLTIAAPPQTPKRVDEPTDREELEESPEISNKEQTVEDQASEEPSTSRDRQAVHLMSKWMDRKAQDRPDKATRPPKTGNERSPGVTEKPIEKPANETELPDIKHGSFTTDDLTIGEQLHAISPKSSLPIVDPDQQISESPIPALQSPAKPSSALSNVFSPRRICFLSQFPLREL